MAKQISKRQWEEIRADFERGLSQAEIRKKYNISPSTLGSKIAREGWRLSHEHISALSDFKEASAKISESFLNANETQKKELLDRTITILEDNELMINNRKILKAFQGKIIAGLKNGAYEKPSDIKAGTSALKDIEAIANPQANKQEINIQNTNAQQVNIKSLDDFYE